MIARSAPLRLREIGTAPQPRRRTTAGRSASRPFPHGAAGVPATEPVVYLVDDDPAMRKSLQFLVASVGLKSKSCGTAAEFLTSVNSDAPGCVVVDVRLPDMSGIELLKMLRNDAIAMPSIIVTAYGDVPLAVGAMKLGAFDFLEKPISDQLLLDQIQRAVALDRHQHQQRAERQSIMARLGKLTPREREVAARVVEGLASKAIAAELKVSYKTVESHRAKIMKRVGAASLAHLIRMWLCAYQNVAPPSVPLPEAARDARCSPAPDETAAE